METKDKAQFHIVVVKGWVEKEGMFLMAKRGMDEVHCPGVWAIPGGKVDDHGEVQDIIQVTLKNEIIEEVGIEIHDDIGFFYNNSFIRDDGAHVVNLTFLCKHKEGEAQPLEDTDEVRWFSLEELLHFEEMPGFMMEEVKALEKYLNSKL